MLPTNKQKSSNFIKKIGLNQSKSKSFSFATKINQINQEVSMKLQKRSLKHIENLNYEKIEKTDLKKFAVIGMMRKQVFCIYNSKLNLYATVDQHAMHQRIRYQYYCRILQNQNIDNFLHHNIEKNNQKKIKVIGTQKYNKLIYISKLDNNIKIISFQRYGIKLTVSENGDVYMENFTQILGKMLPDQILVQICKQIIELYVTKSNRISKTLDLIIAEHSCKNAIKFGDQVSKQWCQDLLLNAAECTFPWKCVHGRPTIHFQWYNMNKIERNYYLQ